MIPASRALAAALLLGGCTGAPATAPPEPEPEPELSPESAVERGDAPPPTFVEREPTTAVIPKIPPPDAGTSLDIDLGQGLTLELRAVPLDLDRSWSFELQATFANSSDAAVFDLGAEPQILAWISITKPDGSGLGSAGGCVYAGHSHGGRSQALHPTQQFEATWRWDGAVEPGHVLEAKVHLCSVDLPDRRTLSGKLGVLEARVDASGRLASFELRATPPPQPK